MQRFPMAKERPPGLEDFLAKIARLSSKKKVRPVVIPSGKRARGHLPSMKAPAGARYDSLLEQEVLRFLEVGTWAHVIRTHPVVLALPGNPLIHYTPDVQAEGAASGILVETKATFFLSKVESSERLLECAQRLAAAGVKLVLITELDVRANGLQDELKELMRLRPVVGRYRPGLNTSPWNPLAPKVTDFAIERRWRAAQRECDELLGRLMGRDPDDVIAAARR